MKTIGHVKCKSLGEAFCIFVEVGASHAKEPTSVEISRLLGGTQKESFRWERITWICQIAYGKAIRKNPNINLQISIKRDALVLLVDKHGYKVIMYRATEGWRVTITTLPHCDEAEAIKALRKAESALTS